MGALPLDGPTYYSLLTTYYLLLTAYSYYSLLTTYYLLQVGALPLDGPRRLPRGARAAATAEAATAEQVGAAPRGVFGLDPTSLERHQLQTAIHIETNTTRVWPRLISAAHLH